MKLIYAAIIVFSACLFIALSAHAVDFSQSDKQAHFFAGCATAEMVRGIATDSGSDDAGWWGLGAGVLMGFAYEAQQSHGGDRQDAYAAAIGSAACIGASEGVRAILNPHGVIVSGTY